MRKYIIGAVFGLVLGTVGVAVSKPTTTNTSSSPTPKASTAPTAKTPAPTVPPSSCANDVAKVSLCTADDPTCGRTLVTPCFPYGCDTTAKVCKSKCSSYTDCANKGVGASCDTATSICVALGQTCMDDFTIRDSDGQVESCIPYKCLGGACQPYCMSNNDCWSGYKCTTSEQICVKK